MTDKAEITVEVSRAPGAKKMTTEQALIMASQVAGSYIDQQYANGEYEVLCRTTIRMLPDGDSES